MSANHEAIEVESVIDGNGQILSGLRVSPSENEF